MKPYTPITGLISLLAVLGTTPASAILIESWETDVFSGSTIYWENPNTASAITLSFDTTTGVTEGSRSLKIETTGGWQNALSFGSDGTSYSNTTPELGGVSIREILAENNTLVADVYPVTGTGWGSLTLAFNGDFLWQQVSSQSFTEGSQNTLTWTIDDTLVSQFVASSYFQMWFIVQNADATAGTVYLDNIRAYGPRLWLTSSADASTPEDSWYGTVWSLQTGEGWFASADQMAWQYGIGTDDGMWTFDSELGWAWTNDAVYPYFYLYDSDSWGYYYIDYSTENEERWYFLWTSEGDTGWSTDTDASLGIITIPYGTE